MAKPLWNGAISFGLLHIPVQLMSGERRVDLHFHLVDSRDNSRVRYERVSEETGEEVPWKDIAKAFEYEKGNYVVLRDEDFRNAAPESSESVDIEAFVDPSEVGPEYFERPYYLVPPKKAEKGYVLLRETLKALHKVAIARVVIRTRESLAMVRPSGDALQLLLLRYPQELVASDAYHFPSGSAKSHRISPRESAMARQLVESMSDRFRPAQYKDEFREKLSRAIRERLKRKGARIARKLEAEPAHEGSDKVVDFMALLRKSIETNQRTLAQTAHRPAAEKPARKRLHAKARPAAPKKTRRSPRKRA
ncbi:Ku protein [Solimonas flava]|uniref:non-homologous end joining protein Ku n=1 Tax=Solimonas flava TaxID=415849 RepID=UPI0003FDDD5B|nr:Ku protein [Solimonas flava]